MISDFNRKTVRVRQWFPIFPTYNVTVLAKCIVIHGTSVPRSKLWETLMCDSPYKDTVERAVNIRVQA